MKLWFSEMKEMQMMQYYMKESQGQTGQWKERKMRHSCLGSHNLDISMKWNTLLVVCWSILDDTLG